MTEIRFYHMERVGLEQALPALLTKALETGRRVVLKLPEETDVERLNDHLWTYNPGSFLPHGAKKDGNAAEQPIWLTSLDENPNNADMLVLALGAQSPDIASYPLCCEMLDGKDKQAIADARIRWQAYKESGHTITYWQQGDKGWEKKSG